VPGPALGMGDPGSTQAWGDQRLASSPAEGELGLGAEGKFNMSQPWGQRAQHCQPVPPTLHWGSAGPLSIRRASGC